MKLFNTGSAMIAIDPPFVRKAAEESFQKGLYCAESVAVALARAQGVESDAVARIASAKRLGERCLKYTGRAAEIAATILAEAQDRDQASAIRA
jgi:hypothetical protein